MNATRVDPVALWVSFTSATGIRPPTSKAEYEALVTLLDDFTDRYNPN